MASATAEVARGVEVVAVVEQSGGEPPVGRHVFGDGRREHI